MVRLASFLGESIVDGPGIRTVIFFQGCPHRCFNCHNPITHSFDKGKLLTTLEAVNMCLSNPLSRGVTISGGEPFAQINELYDFVKLFHKKAPEQDIVIFTGYTFEELQNFNNPLIKKILDKTFLLIDGKYIDELRDLTLFYRGSKNQRVIDVKETLLNNKIILSPYHFMHT